MLPKVEVPTYELTLPSANQTIKYRPFLVKEEKILFVALETGKENDMLIALKDIIKNCTFDAVDAGKIPIFDVEYIFINIRAKSLGEKAKFRVLCPDDGKTYTDVEIDLSKVDVHVNDNHTNKIIIDENKKLGIVLKYPTLDSFKVLNNKSLNSVDNIFSTLIKSVDHIFEGDKIYPAKDISESELKDFFESLPQENFLKFRDFFDTMPKLKAEVEVENPVTKVKNKVVFTGLADFFGSASPIVA